jgi:hypothetical protein
VRASELIAYFMLEKQDRDEEERKQRQKAGMPAKPSVTPFGSRFE